MAETADDWVLRIPWSGQMADKRRNLYYTNAALIEKPNAPAMAVVQDALANPVLWQPWGIYKGMTWAYTDAWERHEGQIRDQVISVCRSATLDELQEPEFATLKARLTDVLAAKLGERPLRQLVFGAVVSQPL